MTTHKRLGDYEILDELGSGGMGRVFRVRNVISDRIEAMKVLLPDLIGREDLAARFHREIKLLAGLSHPNIAAQRTAFSADNQLVMVMELVEGRSVAARLAEGPIATPDALRYVDQVLDALGYAHARQIVHRDVKPANMMLTPHGTVKLTDFGIARSRHDQTLTATGTTTGSLSYMPPEQVRGEATDVRSDLYAVGISLYEMVTGRRPFEATSDFGVMVAQVEARAKPPIELQPALSPLLNDIILKAIEKDPDARFQSAGEFRAAIARVSTQPHTATATAALPAIPATAPAAVAAAAPIPGVPEARTRSGHPLVFVALGAVLVIVALVGTGLYLGRADAQPGAPRAAVDPTPASQPPAPAAPAASTSTPPAGDPPAATPPAPPAPSASTEPLPSAASSTPPPPAGGTPVVVSTPDARTPSSTPVARSAPKVNPPTAPTPPTAPAATDTPTAHVAATAATAAANGPVQNPADPALLAAALEELDEEVELLVVRATAINATLDRMRQEQARQGVGLRADMAGRQERMNLNLTRARDAIDKKDLGRARKFRAAAESELEALERFLGR